MLYTIDTPRGTQTIMSVKDFEDIAREFISEDYADAVSDVLYYAIQECDDMKTYSDDLDEQVSDLESTVLSFECAVNDTMQSISDVMKLDDVSEIKSKLAKVLNELREV